MDDDEDPFADEEIKNESIEKHEDLKESTFVVDMQIPAPVSSLLHFKFEFYRRKP